MTNIEKQKENIQNLLRLIAENPELRIVPMVDISEVVSCDGYGWWGGSLGKAEVDYLYIDDERIYRKNYDCDDLKDQYIGSMEPEQYNKLSADELNVACEKYVANLPWEKVIVVEITVG